MDDLTTKQLEAARHIRNWIAHRGRTPSIRELMGALGYKSPRSAQDILEQLALKGIIRKLESGSFQLLRDPERSFANTQTVNVPIIGSVAAGAPILAEENIEGFIPVSTALIRSGANYYLLRVRGDSMNEVGIHDRDFVLVRRQVAVAQAGDHIVALIDDEATIKEYHPQKDLVILKPRSTNPDNRPIILDKNFQIQGIVVATISNFGDIP